MAIELVINESSPSTVLDWLRSLIIDGTLADPVTSMVRQVDIRYAADESISLIIHLINGKRYKIMVWEDK